MLIGSTVRLKAPVVIGPIVDTQYNKDARCLEHKVEWTDADGDLQNRWFNESDLEEVE